MISETDVDKMLEICFNAVEQMASYLEDRNAVLDEIETDNREQLLNKIFHTLGATVGNFLYAHQEVAEQPEIIEAFKKGLRDYIAKCREEDKAEFDKRPLRLVNWIVDNDAYKN
jgi:hypothetical protein